MKLNKTILVLAVLSFSFTSLTAQLKEKYKPKDNQRTVDDPVAGDWNFGFGLNVVDDGGVILGGLFGGNKYNHFHTPLMVYAEYFYNNQFSFNATISMNKYVEGKYVDRRGTILKDEEPGFLAADLGVKFYFRDIFNDYIFEPYVFSGFGYLSIGGHKIEPQSYMKPEDVAIGNDGNWDLPTISSLTYNLGIGANYWFSKTWGVNVNAGGHWNLKGGEYAAVKSNFTQFSFGAFYCLKK